MSFRGKAEKVLCAVQQRNKVLQILPDQQGKYDERYKEE